MSIRRTNYAQPLQPDVRPSSVSPWWWLMLGWFALMTVVVILNLLGSVLSESPPAPRDRPQGSRPHPVAAAEPALRSSVSEAERIAAVSGASRSRERGQPSARTAPSPPPTPTPESAEPGKPAASGVGLPPLLEVIRSHESGGNYAAHNPGGCEGSGCYGAYQLHGAYAGAWARRYGHPEVAGLPATQWSRQVQDEVALRLFYSTDPDGAHWCAWVDYC